MLSHSLIGSVIAWEVHKRVPPYAKAVGIPRGGIALAQQMNRLPRDDSGIVLVVDDVLTTGNSLLSEMVKYPIGRVLGFVVWDRSMLPLPASIRALFTLTGETFTSTTPIITQEG